MEYPDSSNLLIFLACAENARLISLRTVGATNKPWRSGVKVELASRFLHASFPC